MTTVITHTPAETEALGQAWGTEAQCGWIIGLSGELGAGKTQLVKGLARGLGITERVHSPSFALINQYFGGRRPLFHLDLYRLDTPEQILGAGLEEFLFNPAGVAVVEWAERWPHFNPGPSGFYRRVWMECLSEQERRISYEDFGARVLVGAA